MEAKKKQNESLQIDANHWFVNYKKQSDKLRGWRHGKCNNTVKQIADRMTSTIKSLSRKNNGREATKNCRARAIGSKKKPAEHNK